MRLAFTFEEVKNMPWRERRVIASKMAARDPRAAMAVWETIDLEFWKSTDEAITGFRKRYESSEILTKPLKTPMEIFAEKGMSGPLVWALTIYEKRNSNKGIDAETLGRFVIAAICKGFKGRECERLIDLTIKCTKLSEYNLNDLTIEALINGNVEAALYLAEKRKKPSESTSRFEEIKANRKDLAMALDPERIRFDNSDSSFFEGALKKTETWNASVENDWTFEQKTSNNHSVELMKAGKQKFISGIIPLLTKGRKFGWTIEMAPLILALENWEDLPEGGVETLLESSGERAFREGAVLAMACLAGAGLTDEVSRLTKKCSELGVKIGLWEKVWRNGPMLGDILAVTCGSIPEGEVCPKRDGEDEDWVIRGFPFKGKRNEITILSGGRGEEELSEITLKGGLDLGSTLWAHPHEIISLVTLDENLSSMANKAQRVKKKGVREMVEALELEADLRRRGDAPKMERIRKKI